jgi:hypothetical protein
MASAIASKRRPRFTAQYASGKLHLAEAHRIATVVPVIDSGVETSNPEIGAR